MKGILNPQTVSLFELFSSKRTYTVPKFQRDYSWDEENWQELWEDIKGLTSGREDEHYMGYLVLMETDRDRQIFQIIDGQQRLTTLTVILLAVLKILDESSDPDALIQFDRIRNNFIVHLPFGSNTLEYFKLELNRNNDKVFLKVSKLEAIKPRGLKHTDKLLIGCFNYFLNELQALNLSAKQLGDFVAAFSSKMFFTSIPVTSSSDAYKLFETLNARGVKLSSTDLLKNYLFQIVADGCDDEVKREKEIEKIDNEWNSIYRLLPKNGFPDFLRYYWNISHDNTSKKNLYKEIKKSIDDFAKVQNLIESLTHYVDIYIQIINPTKAFWEDERIVRKLEVLNLFQVRQPVSMLMIAKEKLKNNQFITLLDQCIALSFRYNVIAKSNPNALEPIYNKVSNSLHNTGKYNVDDFKPVYVADEIFVNHLKERDFPDSTKNNRLARYILSQIESTYSQNVNKVDYTNDNITLEHVLPKSNKWNIPSRAFEKSVFKLGNLTLLDDGAQNKVSDDLFAVKKPHLANSSYKITQRIAELDNWDEKTISNNTEWLSKMAKGVWSVQFNRN